MFIVGTWCHGSILCHGSTLCHGAMRCYGGTSCRRSIGSRISARSQDLIDDPFGGSAKYRLEPSDESSLFQVSDCVLDLSRGHQHPLRELCETDDAGEKF